MEVALIDRRYSFHDPLTSTISARYLVLYILHTPRHGEFVTVLVSVLHCLRLHVRFLRRSNLQLGISPRYRHQFGQQPCRGGRGCCYQYWTDGESVERNVS